MKGKKALCSEVDGKWTDYDDGCNGHTQICLLFPLDLAPFEKCQSSVCYLQVRPCVLPNIITFQSRYTQHCNLYSLSVLTVQKITEISVPRPFYNLLLHFVL